MKLVEANITIAELNVLAEEYFGDFVKAVVDVEREIAVFGGELHSDEEEMLLNNGSVQFNLWGINVYPELPREKWVEFDSMINIRPGQNNRTRGVEDPEIRKRVIEIVDKLVI